MLTKCACLLHMVDVTVEQQTNCRQIVIKMWISCDGKICVLVPWKEEKLKTKLWCIGISKMFWQQTDDVMLPATFLLVIITINLGKTCEFLSTAAYHWLQLLNHNTTLHVMNINTYPNLRRYILHQTRVRWWKISPDELYRKKNSRIWRLRLVAAALLRSVFDIDQCLLPKQLLI